MQELDHNLVIAPCIIYLSLAPVVIDIVISLDIGRATMGGVSYRSR